MIEAPRQDWGLYEKRCQESCAERLRSLSASAAFGLYEDLHCFAGVLTASRQEREDGARARWRDKLIHWKEMRAAFVALDRMRDGRDG